MLERWLKNGGAEARRVDELCRGCQAGAGGGVSGCREEAAAAAAAEAARPRPTADGRGCACQGAGRSGGRGELWQRRPRGCSGFGAGCGCRDAAACNAGRDLEAGTDAADGEKFVCITTERRCEIVDKIAAEVGGCDSKVEEGEDVTLADIVVAHA